MRAKKWFVRGKKKMAEVTKCRGQQPESRETVLGKYKSPNNRGRMIENEWKEIEWRDRRFPFPLHKCAKYF